jgi:hypothetical protein
MQPYSDPVPAFLVGIFATTREVAGLSRVSRFLFDYGFEHRLQACASLLRTRFSLFELNPALVEAIQHPHARNRVFHSMIRAAQLSCVPACLEFSQELSRPDLALRAWVLPIQ